MSDQTILVAGAGGFIGGHLVADLLGRGITDIRAVDVKPFDEWYQVFDRVDNVVADLKDREGCRMACRGAKHVYNLAADMGGMGFIENHKGLCMLSVLINTHLLMAAEEADVERFFYASSACVYNADKQRDFNVVALKEEDAYPAMPEDGYGWEKLFSERMCRHFSEDFGLPTRVARFHNVYGPLGTWQGGRGSPRPPHQASRMRSCAARRHAGQRDVCGSAARCSAAASACVSLGSTTMPLTPS